jgi:hypothetical protein
MNRFNEGKTCDAVIRHIEARDGARGKTFDRPNRKGTLPR